jgi:hypothetical protein
MLKTQGPKLYPCGATDFTVYEKEMDSRNTNRRLSICQIAVKPFDITT